METLEYQARMKEIEKNIIEFIDLEKCEKNDYNIILDFLDNQEFNENFDLFYSTLKLISQIIDNHHRNADFFKKIEHIIIHFSDEIKRTLLESEIFHIFEYNKRILLFLIESKILTNIEYIKRRIKKINFFHYQSYNEYLFGENDQKDKELFNLKRYEGENDDYLCKLIRDDNISEFVAYVNKVNISIRKSVIRHSIFETNLLLLKRNPMLIEYAAFFGSIQIFKYLHIKQAMITPTLWIFAIHSKNSELIHYLEEKGVLPPNNSYKLCIKESIKCHHNEITKYIHSNLLFDHNEDEIYIDRKCMKYFSFNYFPKDVKNDHFFFLSCKYDHYNIVRLILNETDLNPNVKVVLNFYFILFKIKISNKIFN